MTPTPGAASELLPTSVVESCEAWLRGDIGSTQFYTELHEAFAAHIHAPVTEGAQREAVAWVSPLDTAKSLVVSDEVVQASCDAFDCETNPRECIYGSDAMRAAIDAAIGILLAQGLIYPPPPDRVQPERVEAEYAEGVPKTDIRVFQKASSPPTDASGGVTVTTNENGECIAVTRQDGEGRILSVIWEAADRARKPDTSAQAASAGDASDLLQIADAIDPHSDPVSINDKFASPYEQAEYLRDIAARITAPSASAGELCVRAADLLVEADVMETLSKSRKYTVEAREVYSWSARELRMMAEQTMLRTGAPTDGRSQNDGAYREVTIGDAGNCYGAFLHATDANSVHRMMAGLKAIKAFIRCPTGEKP